jgi:hypothetical protein
MLASSPLELAARIREALFALPDERLLEVIDQWASSFLEQGAKDHIISTYLRILGYQIRSVESGEIYDTYLNFNDFEPGAEEFALIPLNHQALREKLHAMPIETFYQQILSVEIQGLQRSQFPQWDDSGGPSLGRKQARDLGLQYLLHYLALRNEAAHLSQEQFEIQEQEQIAALAVHLQPEQEYTSDKTANMLTNERLWHFRIKLVITGLGHQQTIIDALQKQGAVFQEAVSEDTLEGVIPYIYWHQDDLNALRRARKLLNGWQTRGWLSWNVRKMKPPQRKNQGKSKKRSPQRHKKNHVHS